MTQELKETLRQTIEKVLESADSPISAEELVCLTDEILCAIEPLYWLSNDSLAIIWLKIRVF